MPTVAEVLKSSGWTDEQIAALDQKATEGLTAVLSTADQLKEAAELKERQVREYMSTQVTPALNNWASEKARIEAENAYYRKLAEEAKAGGFVGEVTPPGSPISDGGQPRNAQGQFVAGQNAVPGSPGFDPAQFREGVGQYIGTMQDLAWKYQTLFGSPMPDPPTQIVREAREQKLDPVTYAAKKYGFQQKEQEIAQKKEADRVAALRRDIETEVERKYAERAANPALRAGEASGFSQVQKAVQAGTRPDPTMQTEAQRRATTRDMIQRDLSEKSQVQ